MVRGQTRRLLSRWKRRPFARGRLTVERGYTRILVPILDNPESERAVDVACRLSVERHAAVTAVTVIEIPPLLPLDAHMIEEEEDAHGLLARARAIGESYGVGISTRILRARTAESAIVEEATTTGVEIVVIGGARKIRRGTRAPIFGDTVRDVLKMAPCRVMVIASQGEPGVHNAQRGARERAPAASR